MKGKASKFFVKSKNLWVYSVGFAIYQFHGDEGEKGNLQSRPNTSSHKKATSNHIIHRGAKCLVQNDNYDMHDAKTEKRRMDSEETPRKKSRPNPYTFDYTDNKEEEEPPDSQKDLLDQLKHTQGQVILLTSVLKRVHSTIELMAMRLREGIGLMKRTTSEVEGKTKVELTKFTKENTGIIRNILKPMEHEYGRLAWQNTSSCMIKMILSCVLIFLSVPNCAEALKCEGDVFYDEKKGASNSDHNVFPILASSF